MREKETNKIFYLIIVQFIQFSINFSYGKHYPNGNSSINHLYSSEGTWKEMKNLGNFYFKKEYIWNYYEQWSTPRHPFNKTALINYANGSRFTTCRDANGFLINKKNKEYYFGM
jgi:hypothetical protein